MRDPKRAVPQAESGLVLAQFYVDAFYEDIESMPRPDTDAFDVEVDRLTNETTAAIKVAFDAVTAFLAAKKIKLVVAER